MTRSFKAALRACCLGGILFCLPHARASAQSDATHAYILQYRDIAQEEMERTGVPAAISLAQGILESQSGRGWLVLHSHNHFGIKCKSSWTGPIIRYDDDKKNECFRVYQTDDSSWRDHSDFLRNSPRYAFLFYLPPTDYKAWAMGLKKAGYATDKHYVDRLIQTVETYHLEQYSDQVLAMEKGKSGQEGKPKSDFEDLLDKKVNADRLASGVETPSPAPATTTSVVASSAYPSGTFQINNLRVIYLPAGSQLITVAEAHHLRLSRLLSYNEMQSDVTRENTLVYLEKKGKRGAHETHRVLEGETLHAIAQKEGIRLKWLCKKNNLSADQVPIPGELLYLDEDAPGTGKPRSRGFGYFVSHLFSGKKKSVETVEKQTMATGEDASTAATETAPGTIPGTSYQVKQGDTLYGISKKYEVSVSDIKQWNNIQGDAIQAGQTLIIKNK